MTEQLKYIIENADLKAQLGDLWYSVKFELIEKNVCDQDGGMVEIILIEDVAKLFKVSVREVNKWVRFGFLPSPFEIDLDKYFDKPIIDKILERANASQ